MLFDLQTLLSDKQSIAQVAGNYLSTNTIDLGVAGTPVLGGTVASDIGRGLPVAVVAQITTAVTSAGAATVQAQLVTADDAALSTNLTVIAQTDAIAKASLVPGYKFRLGTVPPGITQRYLGVRYVIGAATTTAGNVTAGLVLQGQDTFVG